jgi:hypothetical protein
MQIGLIHNQIKWSLNTWRGRKWRLCWRIICNYLDPCFEDSTISDPSLRDLNCVRIVDTNEDVLSSSNNTRYYVWCKVISSLLGHISVATTAYYSILFGIRPIQSNHSSFFDMNSNIIIRFINLSPIQVVSISCDIIKILCATFVLSLRATSLPILTTELDFCNVLPSVVQIQSKIQRFFNYVITC